MKNLLLPLLLVLASGCIDLQGNLDITEKMVLKHKTVFNNVKYVTLNPGQYNATFKISHDQKFKLSIQGRNKDIKLKTNRSIQIPANGNILVSASDMGQKYDLDISMQTQTQRGDDIRRHESCSYIRYERRCHGGRNGQIICREVPITRHGTQTRVFYVNTTKRAFSAEFLLPNSNMSVAKFHGRNTSRHEVTEFRSHCF